MSGSGIKVENPQAVEEYVEHTQKGKDQGETGLETGARAHVGLPWPSAPVSGMSRP